jgi:hypothetical protein
VGRELDHHRYQHNLGTKRGRRIFFLFTQIGASHIGAAVRPAPSRLRGAFVVH